MPYVAEIVLSVVALVYEFSFRLQMSLIWLVSRHDVYEIANALAANGYIVYVGSRKFENGQIAAAEIGENAKAIQLNVTQQLTINAAVESIEKEEADLICS